MRSLTDYDLHICDFIISFSGIVSIGKLVSLQIDVINTELLYKRLYKIFDSHPKSLKIIIVVINSLRVPLLLAMARRTSSRLNTGTRTIIQIMKNIIYLHASVIKMSLFCSCFQILWCKINLFLEGTLQMTQRSWKNNKKLINILLKFSTLENVSLHTIL